MSWNCLIMVARDTTMDDLAAAGVAATGQPQLSGEEATSSSFEGIAAGPVGTDVLLLSSGAEHLDAGTALAARLGREVVSAAFGGVSDVYCWSVDSPTEHRSLVRAVDDVVVDEGTPVAEEGDLDHLDEDSLFDLLQARTGLPTDWYAVPVTPVRMRW